MLYGNNLTFFGHPEILFSLVSVLPDMCRDAYFLYQNPADFLYLHIQDCGFVLATDINRSCCS